MRVRECVCACVCVPCCVCVSAHEWFLFCVCVFFVCFVCVIGCLCVCLCVCVFCGGFFVGVFCGGFWWAWASVVVGFGGVPWAVAPFPSAAGLPCSSTFGVELLRFPSTAYRTGLVPLYWCGASLLPSSFFCFIRWLQD